MATQPQSVGGQRYGGSVTASESPTPMTLVKMLEEEPLYSESLVVNLFHAENTAVIVFPSSIRVHCEHGDCNGVRRHEIQRSKLHESRRYVYGFVDYVCTNCVKTFKVFGLKTTRLTNNLDGFAKKIYQEPAFGHPIPKRLFEITGEENRNFFLQARRAIARGLGIGAYAHYRRIIENTKFALVEAVLIVARATNAPSDQIRTLEEAQGEKQFSKAIENLSGAEAIPPVLLIDGQNPLTLIHDLLSRGIHELSDEECLQRAQDAEVILCEVAERMQIAMSERKAVKTALSNIMSRQRKDEKKTDQIVSAERVCGCWESDQTCSVASRCRKATDRGVFQAVGA